MANFDSHTSYKTFKQLQTCTQNIKISLSKYMPGIPSLKGPAAFVAAQKQMHAFIHPTETVGGWKQISAAIATTGQAKEDFILN